MTTTQPRSRTAERAWAETLAASVAALLPLDEIGHHTPWLGGGDAHVIDEHPGFLKARTKSVPPRLPSDPLVDVLVDLLLTTHKL